MQTEPSLPPGELLRRAMRYWVTGVAIVTSRSGDLTHGMTVNSFVSVSLDPPLVTVTMNNDTRTFGLVQQSSVFAVTILSQPQQVLAELFAGRLVDERDRMEGVKTFSLVTGAPLIAGGLAYLDCRVVHQYAMPRSTLLVGEVVAALTAESEPVVSPEAEDLEPLVYLNRRFIRLNR